MSCAREGSKIIQEMMHVQWNNRATACPDRPILAYGIQKFESIATDAWIRSGGDGDSYD